MGNMSVTPELVDKLCAASRANPSTEMHWPDEVPPDGWYFSPELISLEGLPEFASLSESARARLSFFEAVNFFSLNIHGEKSLVAGLAGRLYQPQNAAVTPYLHHFLDEENQHMRYFGGFCSRYAGKVYPDKKLAFPRNYMPGEEDFLFFARVLIFEEIVDGYNQVMARDERLEPLAREINRRHHFDESRHLVFGRQLVRELYARHAPDWAAEGRQCVADYLHQYLEATWREYYNPAVYRDTGLQDDYGLFEAAWHHPLQKARRARADTPIRQFFQAAGVFPAGWKTC